MFYGQSRHCEDYTRQTYCFMVKAVIVKITRGRHIVLWSKPSSWRLHEADTYCFMVEAVIVEITRGRHILFYGRSRHRGDYKRQTHIVLWSKPSSWRLQEADTYCFMVKAVIVKITRGRHILFYGQSHHCENYTRQTYCFMVKAVIVKITRGRHIVLWSKPSL